MSGPHPNVFYVQEFAEDPSLRIQLTPTIPTVPSGSEFFAVVQPGCHRSEWIRVLDRNPGIDPGTLSTLVSDSVAKKSGAVYVGLPQSFVGNSNSTNGRDCLALLLSDKSNFGSDGKPFQFYNFDPMGFSTRQPEFLPWYREAELKHGRICMLAWVGLVVPDFVRIPGPEEYYGVKNVVEAHNVFVGKNNLGPLFQVFMFVGIVEILTTFAKCTTSDGLTLENAGDYRFGLNFLPKDPEKAKEMRLKELKNGRLAMIAFGGAITQAVLSGNGFPWLYS